MPKLGFAIMTSTYGDVIAAQISNLTYNRIDTRRPMFEMTALELVALFNHPNFHLTQ